MISAIWIGCAFSLHGAEVALIVDDMGNKKNDARVFELPSEVALSILPHTPLSKPFSTRAAAQKREVMLHIPMESLTGKRLGPGALTADMHPHVIEQTLESALASVPNAIGVNNHMGSKLTQLTLPMRTTMEFLKRHSMFFVDSRTTRYSKAERIARETGLLSGYRSVFLDHSTDPDQIDRQFKRLIRLAKKYDQVIGIAHPYPQTVDYLKQALPELSEQGVRLVPLSEILHTIQLSRSNETRNSDSVSL